MEIHTIPNRMNSFKTTAPKDSQYLSEEAEKATRERERE